MSMMDDDSPSSSDDFAAFPETELDSTCDTSLEQKEDQDANETYHLDINRTKRQKIDVLGSVESSAKEEICTHPGIIGGMCIKCGKKMDNQTGVAFGYIHKDLRLAHDEITRLRDRDLKSLLSHKKLCLVLDLDHTLLNSTRISDLTQEEGHLINQSDHIQDALNGSLFKLSSGHMLTKLRPFVHTFLKEASKLFEMYIYTMGDRAYALQMANFLDPKMVYFDSRVIAKSDCTQRHRKGLDVVPCQESVVLILDDNEKVWVKHKENLILMERYNFFASSCKEFGYGCKSLSELKSDESEVDGALARILQKLKQIHNMFFDPEIGDNFTVRDVRQLWKMADQLGATCVTNFNPSVTHVISIGVGTYMTRWAAQKDKFLVGPRWLEATYYLWKKQPEEMFPVEEMKNKR